MFSRREFIRTSTIGAATLGMTTAGCAKAEKAEKKEEITMVGACGLSCQVCPLMKAGKCKGCGPGTSEKVKKAKCPVWSCAQKKKLEYCGRDCPGFTKCTKVIGKPYAQEYMDGIKKRLA